MRDTPVEHSPSLLHLQKVRLQLERKGFEGSTQMSDVLLEGVVLGQGG